MLSRLSLFEDNLTVSKQSSVAKTTFCEQLASTEETTLEEALVDEMWSSLLGANKVVVNSCLTGTKSLMCRSVDVSSVINSRPYLP